MSSQDERAHGAQHHEHDGAHDGEQEGVQSASGLGGGSVRGEVVLFARGARRKGRDPGPVNDTHPVDETDAADVVDVADVLGELDQGSAGDVRAMAPARRDVDDLDEDDEGAGDGGDDGRPGGELARQVDDATDAEGDAAGEVVDVVGDGVVHHDRESVLVEGVVVGRVVDPADEAETAPWRQKGSGRPTVVPPALRSRTEFRAASTWAARSAGYVLMFHGLRAPKYALFTAFYGTVGVFRTVGRFVHWSTAEQGNWGLRQHAASKNDADLWLKLDRQRQHQTSWRTWVLGLTSVTALVAVLVLVYGPVPELVRAAVLALVLVVAARAGRPADRPILERTSQSTKYRKLTADLVRRGLLSLQLAGINSAVTKDPHAISFPAEIHRDGPGHLAVVDLPYGVEASDVIARRGRLASAMRLPLDQVWPEAAAGHPGRLALWVGHQPASAMKQPTWPLLKGGTVDVFKDFDFATTPRMDPVRAALMFRNWLIGGQPGSGKSFALRLLVLAAALDVRCEIRGYELAGKGDFAVLEPVLAEYGNGMDDDTLARCTAMIDWLYAELDRRSIRLRHYAKLGKAPENKVTPELASLKDSGLHPLVVFIDEAQELFTSKWGKEAGVLLEKAIKLARAYGVIVLIGTQIPDKDSLPPGITRNINTRYCLSVADQTANDMVLGTSAYKLGLRATVFEPVVEAGWGIVRGVGKPGARRSFYLDTRDAAQVVARAHALRADAGTLPAAPATRELGAGYDVLADVLQVWPDAEDRVWNETLLPLLVQLRPDVYTGWEPAQLTAALKPHGVDVDQIGRRVDGRSVTRRGPARADVIAATRRAAQRTARDGHQPGTNQSGNGA